MRKWPESPAESPAESPGDSGSGSAFFGLYVLAGVDSVRQASNKHPESPLAGVPNKATAQLFPPVLPDTKAGIWIMGRVTIDRDIILCGRASILCGR